MDHERTGHAVPDRHVRHRGGPGPDHDDRLVRRVAVASSATRSTSRCGTPKRPGVLEGVPVRKSGIRIGEVSAIAFDERPNQPDGVLVTLALERRYQLREGSVPRLTRSLIGDVTIDMQPGNGPEFIATGKTPGRRPGHRGRGRPRPVQGPGRRHQGLREGRRHPPVDQRGRRRARQAHQERRQPRRLPDDLDTAPAQDVSEAAQGIKRLHRGQRGQFPAGHGRPPRGRQKLNSTLDPETQTALKDGHQPVLLGRRPARRRARRARPGPQGPGRQGQPHADHRHRPGRPPHQRDRRRPRAADQQAPRRPGRAQHRRQPPEAAHPERAARQLEPHGRLGQPGLRPAQDGAGHAADLRREGRLRPVHPRPRCVGR